MFLTRLTRVCLEPAVYFFSISEFLSIILCAFSECARLAIEDMGRYLQAKEGEVAVRFHKFYLFLL